MVVRILYRWFVAFPRGPNELCGNWWNLEESDVCAGVCSVRTWYGIVIEGPAESPAEAGLEAE